MDNVLLKLMSLCKKHGVEVVEKSPGHFHLKGAAYLVNYYPLSKAQTAYVAGTTEALKHTTPAQAVAIAAGTEGFKIATIDRRPKNSKAKRWALWEAGKRSCFWCCQPFRIFAETTLEHVIPLSRGGLDNPNNYALSHERCNRDRGNLLPHQPAPIPESPTVSRAIAFELLKLQHQAKQNPGRYAEKLARKQVSLQAWDDHFPDGTVFPPISWTGMTPRAVEGREGV